MMQTKGKTLTPEQREIYYQFNGAEPEYKVFVKDHPFNLEQLLHKELEDIKAALAYRGRAYYSGHGEDVGLIHLLNTAFRTGAQDLLAHVCEKGADGVDTFFADIFKNKTTSDYLKRFLSNRAFQPEHAELRVKLLKAAGGEGLIPLRDATVMPLSTFKLTKTPTNEQSEMPDLVTATPST